MANDKKEKGGGGVDNPMHTLFCFYEFFPCSFVTAAFSPKTTELL